MEHTLLTATDRQLAQERNLKFQGTVRIYINQITPHPSISGELDPKNVNRLREIFSQDRCRRLDIRNHVTAIVSNQNLAVAIQTARVTPESLKTNPPDRYPLLEFPEGQVQCLHGQHRLKAGADRLPPGEQWWTVDLYLDDLSANLLTALVDEYSNEKAPNDGEVFLKIRQYQSEGNAHFERRWTARLSPNKAKRLRQLSSRVDVRAAFDRLRKVPALLLQGMKFGSLTSVLATSCDEEIVHGLDSLLEDWSYYLGHNSASMLKMDPDTVAKLQGMAPGIASQEAAEVEVLLSRGAVFQNFTFSERMAIGERLKERKTVIPSLYKFFRDMRYLEACANCMKRLAAPSRDHPTVKAAFMHIFKPDYGNNECCIQTSETKFRQQPGTQAERAELGYRQLWLYAKRHYPKVPKEPESDDLVAKASCEKADESVLHGMAVLAQRLGFNSPRIQRLVNESPDRQMARDILLRARKPEIYQYDSSTFESLVTRICDCLAQAISVDHHAPLGPITSREIQPKARWGLPLAKDQKQDSQFLFFDVLHTDNLPPDSRVTTFLVRQCTYLTFFDHQRYITPFPQTSVLNSQYPGPLFVSPGPPEVSDINMGESGQDDSIGTRSPSLGSREPSLSNEGVGTQDVPAHQTDRGLNEMAIPSVTVGRPADEIEVSQHLQGKLDRDSTGTQMDVERAPETAARPDDEVAANMTGEHPTDGAQYPDTAGSTPEDYRDADDILLPDAQQRTIGSWEPKQGDIGRVASDREETLAQLSSNSSPHTEKELPHVHRPVTQLHASDLLGASHGSYNAIESSTSATSTDGHLPVASTMEDGPAGYGTSDAEETIARDRSKPGSQRSSMQEQAASGEARVTSMNTETDLTEIGSHKAPETLRPAEASFSNERRAEMRRVRFDDSNRRNSPRRQGRVRSSSPQGRDQIRSRGDSPSRGYASRSKQTERRPRETGHHDIGTSEPLRRITRVDFTESQPNPHSDQAQSPSGTREGLIHADGSQSSSMAKKNPPAKAGKDDGHSADAHYGKRSRLEKGKTRIDFADDERDIAGASDTPATAAPQEKATRKVLTPRIVKKPSRYAQPTAPANYQPVNSEPVLIKFRAQQENGSWRTEYTIQASSSDTSELERTVRNDMRNRGATFYNHELRKIQPGQCFEAAVEDDINTVFMRIGGELVVDEKTLKSIQDELEL